MATISSVTLNITKNVANADFDLSYTVNWTQFDQLTNLTYLASWRLIGDDTGQDGDDGPAGDDPIPTGLSLLRRLSSNGNATTTITEPTRTIAWVDLNEDSALGSPADNDDEIRAVVTLTPLLPTGTSRESAVVLVTSP